MLKSSQIYRLSFAFIAEHSVKLHEKKWNDVTEFLK